MSMISFAYQKHSAFCCWNKLFSTSLVQVSNCNMSIKSAAISIALKTAKEFAVEHSNCVLYLNLTYMFGMMTMKRGRVSIHENYAVVTMEHINSDIANVTLAEQKTNAAALYGALIKIPTSKSLINIYIRTKMSIKWENRWLLHQVNRHTKLFTIRLMTR